MVLTRIQREIMASIAANRSDSSYVAGGVALNKDWPRVSDDIDIFHDTDEEIGASAQSDIARLRADGFSIAIDVNIYGCVEATVTRGNEQSLIQWMSETKTRFFPLVRDVEWGARLHRVDLAVNKVIAASSRRKARDYVDLLMIATNMCALGPIIMAAAGKPPYFSPLRMVEEMRRRALSITAEEYLAVRGLPEDWTASTIRDEFIVVLEQAETYLRHAPADLVGLLALDASGRPVEVVDPVSDGAEYRRATSEPEAVPDLPEAGAHWNKLK